MKIKFATTKVDRELHRTFFQICNGDRMMKALGIGVAWSAEAHVRRYLNTSPQRLQHEDTPRRDKNPQ